LECRLQKQSGRLAADQGEAIAHYSLGVLYDNGQGIPQDDVQAHMWINLAVAQSSGEDRDWRVRNRDIIAAKMTAEQIAKSLKRQGCVPRRLITDKLRSYPAACRTVMPSVVHVTDQYAINRAEASHQPTRQRERQIRRFKSPAHLQRFAAVHGVVQNHYRVARHLLRAADHRLLRMRAFVEWNAVTCAS